MTTRTLPAAAFTLLFSVGQLHGQCPPVYGNTGAMPGVGDGYAGPSMVWNDGTGDSLYVGGSFTEIGGAFTHKLARNDARTDTWMRLGTGLSNGFTNGFLASMISYQGKLVVAGRFTNAGGVAGTEAIAAWDGEVWQSLGLTVPAGNAIWDMAVGDLGQGPRLFVAGGFGIPFGGIAQFDGTTWRAVGTGVGINGAFSPYIGDIEIFNDGSGPALYVVGRFDTIDGVPAQLAAKFNGTAWSRIGAGITRQGDALKYLSAATVFNDGTGAALYVGGTQFGINGRSGSFHVAKWTGGTTTTSWTGVGQVLGTGRVTALRGWNDGVSANLYFAGTAFPGINNFGRLVGNQWVGIDGSLRDSSTVGAATSGNFPSAFGLGEWNGDLVITGSFITIGPTTARGIATLGQCCPCKADYNVDGGVDGSDLEAFFLDFAAGSAEADVNCDGGTDGPDIESFITAWQRGAC